MALTVVNILAEDGTTVIPLYFWEDGSNNFWPIAVGAGAAGSAPPAVANPLLIGGVDATPIVRTLLMDSNSNIAGIGGTTDAAVSTDANGSVNAHVRGLVKLLAALIGTAGTASADVLSVQGIASMTPLTIAAIPAGTNNIGVVTPKNGLTNAYLDINLSSTGQITPTPTNKSHLRCLYLVASAPCTIQLVDGSGGSALTGVISLAALTPYFLPFPANADDVYMSTGTNTHAIYATIVGTTQISGFSWSYDS